MKIKLNKTVSLDEIREILSNQFPQYQVTVDKNPLFGTQYVLVKKSGASAAFVQIKGETLIVDGVIPSVLLRALLIFAGLIFFIIALLAAKSKIAQPVYNLLHGIYVLNQPLPTQKNSGDGINQPPEQTSENLKSPVLLIVLPIIGIVFYLYFIVRDFEYYRYLLDFGFTFQMIFPILLIFLCLISQIILLLKKKAGFYIFAGAVAGRLIHGLILFGADFFSGMLILFLCFEIALVIAYAFLLKYLK